MSSIKDVARLAGVSIATVSRTLAEPEKVSEATQRKVQTAIRRSGYVRNELARSFRMQRTQTILVLLPDIGNPFYSLIVQGMEEIAQRYGFRILLGDMQNRAGGEAKYLQTVSQRQVDGVISLGSTLPAIPQRKGSARIPLIMACEYLHDDAVTSVSIDNVAAAQLATQHLLDHGHTRIAFINGPATTPLSKDRLLGYRRALKRAGLSGDKALIVRGDFSLASGERAARELLESKARFSAIFAASDAMAIGAIKELRARGKRVPHDISIVGFDDIEFAQYVEPPLTTIHQPRREIGRAAMQQMLSELGAPVKPMQRQLVLEHHLVARGSSVPPRQ
ncbi:MAG TPA: LacI family DNA-binding transcriptional regulator [Spongiibacteraceae bacterium]|jgi:LacI family repressor for deo operon, udp, cdd, tsx, nupC, and nupG